MSGLQKTRNDHNHARQSENIMNRPAPTPQPIEDTLDHLYDRYKKEYALTDDVAFVRSKTMNCKGCESNTCAEVCQLWQQEHDATIRNQTLDDVWKARQKNQEETLWGILQSLRTKEQP